MVHQSFMRAYLLDLREETVDAVLRRGGGRYPFGGWRLSGQTLPKGGRKRESHWLPGRHRPGERKLSKSGMKLIWKRTCSLVRPLLTEEGLSYFLLVVLMGITLATLSVTTNTTNTTNATVVGVYGGWRDADRVDSFYSWLDYPGEHYAHEFIDHRYGWDTIGA